MNMFGWTKPSLESPSWQAWLILLPVLVLALAGLHALRQDRRLVESEARDRARRLANDWLRSISEEWDAIEDRTTNRSPNALSISHPPTGCFFELDAKGELIFPPDYSLVPDPEPFDLATLSSDQLQLWQAAQGIEPRTEAALKMSEAFQRFSESRPPPRFEALGRFGAALQLLRAGRKQDAAATFAGLAATFPTQVTESGLRFSHLADLHRLQLGEVPREALPHLCSNAVYRPSLLTPQLLELAEQAKNQDPAFFWSEPNYQDVWARHELTREIVRAARRQVQLRSADSLGLVLHSISCFADGKSFAVIRLNRSVDETAKMLAVPVGNRVLSDNARFLLAENRGDVFGVTVSVAGTVIHQEGFPGSQQPHLGKSDSAATEDAQWPVMGTAGKSQDNAEMLRIHVHLANVALFYSRHRQRTAWFALVIAAASVTAFFGWRTTRGAFRRQQQLNEMKTNFVSSVSHELRAPIASVRLLAEGLESGRVKEEAKKHEYFKFIGQECRRLSSLIENVLDFSRIEQGRKQYEFEPTDAAALARHTVELMKPYAHERSVQLEHVFNDPQPSTLNSQPILDGRAIQQALVNLIDNAIKHSPKGSTVTIGLELPPAPKRESRITNHGSRIPLPPAPRSDAPRLHIWVEDHGEGIPPEEHERIFERFHRLGSELRRETQGVGIGLSIVKHIVEAHGGRITVRSAVGHGSRFTVELPLTPNPGGGEPAKT